MSEEDENQTRSGWIGAALAGAIVAGVTGGLSIAAVLFAEDEQKCTSATEFFVGFSNASLYTEEEIDRLKAIYFRLAEENCVGQDDDLRNLRSNLHNRDRVHDLRADPGVALPLSAGLA